jgi:hypothetical protein
MPGGHSTLNMVVLGEGVSKSKYTPYFGHHRARPRAQPRFGPKLAWCPTWVSFTLQGSH